MDRYLDAAEDRGLTKRGKQRRERVKVPLSVSEIVNVSERDYAHLQEHKEKFDERLEKINRLITACKRRKGL